LALRDQFVQCRRSALCSHRFTARADRSAPDLTGRGGAGNVIQAFRGAGRDSGPARQAPNLNYLFRIGVRSRLNPPYAGAVATAG
jgi:hypothetical protein